MCYTEDKLEHKTKILTNNTKIKKDDMADKTKIKSQEFDPEKWKKENGIDYATYANEKNYVSQEEISSEQLAKLKTIREKLENLGTLKRKLAVKH